MSFNPDIHITRANYEEYFLLYTDGELSPAAMDAVDAFTLLHPDLREELELLLETRLDGAPVTFGDTSALMAESMRRAASEEDLLHYIDGELDAPAARALEARLEEDAALRAEAALLMAVKLDPADTIEFPDKQSLYRREKERRPLIWWRVAAAVLLFGTGAALWLKGRSTIGPESGKGVVAVTGNRNAGHPQTVPAESVTAATGSTTNNKEVKTNSSDRINTGKNDARSGQLAVAEPKKKVTAAQPAGAVTPAVQRLVPDVRDRVPANDGLIASNDLPRNERIDALETRIRPSQNIGDLPVTNEVTLAYTSSKATPPEATTAVLQTEKPQASVRGLLRKAARFVEKRTGIRATNEDDQLVVGAVAINLK
ncbi:hypothetical protein EPD60_03105 [Flaviaesturariibacter flavus]|uniref:Uncharacterized protein n=1 Tax=Flaviaesturariibacter flavus TaxID=2502780 RepID=A0A4V2NWV0_9BACT|nr:hypothetical protein [Flaviaesturariibacter flavus]TCJ18762.1 hypothetical protein EPD60_03105 [Flaviaesturariibacter flavus]